MATPFDRLMMTIRPHLPGAMDEAIRVELFGVCHEFFDLSNAWQEEIPFTMKAGKQEVEILPTAGKINRLMGVRTVDSNRPVYGSIMTAENTIRIRWAPPQDEKLIAVCAITVSDPTAKDSLPIAPYSTVQTYTQDLIHGICAKMMIQPSKPYTNLAMAQYHDRAFRGGAARARNENNIGNTYGSQKWTYPQSFNTHK
jgi:hypothetical protein